MGRAGSSAILIGGAGRPDPAVSVLCTEAICWEIHPLRWEKRAKSVLLVAILIISSLAAAIGFEHWFYGIFSCFVLTFALSRYFFPTHYMLDNHGVEYQHLNFRRRRSWTEFRSVEVHRDGVFLRSLDRPSRLDSFRGLFLKFHQNREEVVYFVRCHAEQ